MEYTVIKNLGRGNEGIVDLVEKNNKKYVRKTIPITSENTINKIRRQFIILKHLEKICKPYFLCITDVKFEEYEVSIFTEYIKGTSTLLSYIKNRRISLGKLYDIIIVLVKGLVVLHSNGVVHRDIKPENILIREEKGKIFCNFIDFGGSCIDPVILDQEQKELSEYVSKYISPVLLVDDMGISPPSTGISRISGLDNLSYIFENCEKIHLGSPYYVAPEIVKGEITDFSILYKSDIWSLGITFFYMAFKKRPYYGKTTLELLKEIRNLKDTNFITEYISRNFVDKEYIKKCIGIVTLFCNSINPQFRKTAEEVLKELKKPYIRFEFTEPSGVVQDDTPTTIPYMVPSDPLSRTIIIGTEKYLTDWEKKYGVNPRNTSRLRLTRNALQPNPENNPDLRGLKQVYMSEWESQPKLPIKYRRPQRIGRAKTQSEEGPPLVEP